jgi:hypothetical protein
MEGEWRPEDLIGYFYPDMPSTWGTDEIIMRDHFNYYRTAYSFLRQFHDACEDYNIVDDELARNLHSCLMGRALHWWSNLPSQSKNALASNNDYWYDALLGAFELSPDETFAAFDNVRYTINDALNDKHPRLYLQLLRLAAEQCGIPENELAIWAWQHLEYPIRRLIPRPRKGISLKGFGNVLFWNIEREYWNKPPSRSQPAPKRPVAKPVKTQHTPSAQQPPSHSQPTEKLQEVDSIQKPIPNQPVLSKPKVIHQEAPAAQAKPPAKATHPDIESPSAKVSLYSKRGMTISPSSMVRIPIRNHSARNIDSNRIFTPTVLFSAHCRCTLDADFLKVFNYSSKPFIINRRARLGSIHCKPP